MTKREISSEEYEEIYTKHEDTAIEDMIVGGAVGFVTGGPVGAAVGAATGFATGEARSRAAIKREVAERENN
ncbi:MAG: glycine zipper domain-containing protein [Rhodobacteraceae bacterium]|nr:glycine zipper domain-containing protein [Paracoccaceae bacterium]